MKPWTIFLVMALVLRAAEMPSSDATEQIARLRREIARHDELYHRKAAPEISDADYDRLRRALAELERAFPTAAKNSPPLADIGDDRSGLFPTYRHSVPMLGLEKAYTSADVRTFHARLARLLGRADCDFVIEPKYDGLAVSVTFERGRLVRAATRGNGLSGDDITTNVRAIDGLATTLRGGGTFPVPETIELRGEVYVPLAEFERVNAEREAAGEPRFAHPRNLAAGTLRQLDASEIGRRGLRVVFYGIGACEPEAARPASQRELCRAIAEWGQPTITESWTTRGVDGIVHALEAIERTRSTLAYPTDGAVVKLDLAIDQLQAGVSESAPRWALAYKFAPERVEAELRAITLQVGRTGVLTPVAELVPVQLGGSKISRATLHNREEIARKDLRVGDVVYVEKAGDVIPAIVGVNLARRPATAQPFQFPITCPECFAPLTKADGEVAVRCPNFDCPAQARRRIEHFASSACMDIDGLGPAMIEVLVGNGWVKDLPDLYRVNRADLLTLGRNNEKSMDRLLAAIERSKRAELWRVIHGMGLPQVGAATAKDLARQCGSLAGLAEHGGRAATVLAEPRYQNLIADLIAVGVAPVEPAAARSPVAGKTFVLTGTLPHLTRAQATAKIEAAGGKVSGAVTRATDYVVVGADPGTKLAQAREHGVKILDEVALLKLLEAR